MKKTLWNITLSSIITLVAYLALYAVWGAVLDGFDDHTFRLFLIALMTTVAFGAILLYISKIRKSVGEDEVIADYKEKKYISLTDDLKLIVKREAQTLISIAVIVLICFALNTFDSVVFEKKTVSFPTFLFAPMCLFDSIIDIPFVGYALSAVLDCVSYTVFLLFYRKRTYDYWMKNKV